MGECLCRPGSGGFRPRRQEILQRSRTPNVVEQAQRQERKNSQEEEECKELGAKCHRNLPVRGNPLEC